MHFNLSRSPLINDIGSYTGLLLNKLDVSSNGIQYIRFVRFVICRMKLLSFMLRSEEQVARLIVGGLYYRQTINMCSRAALSQQKRGADRGKPWTFHTWLKFMEVTTALIPYLQRHPRLFCSSSEPSHSHGQLFSHTLPSVLTVWNYYALFLVSWNHSKNVLVHLMFKPWCGKSSKDRATHRRLFLVSTKALADCSLEKLNAFIWS